MNKQPTTDILRRTFEILADEYIKLIWDIIKAKDPARHNELTIEISEVENAIRDILAEIDKRGGNE